MLQRTGRESRSPQDCPAVSRIRPALSHSKKAGAYRMHALKYYAAFLWSQRYVGADDYFHLWVFPCVCANANRGRM